MRARARRGLQRTLEVLDWRTFIVAGAVITLLIVGYLVYTSVERARAADARATAALEALEAAAGQGIDIRMAQSRRIDRLEDAVAANRDINGQQAEAIRTLVAQLRQAGIDPATTGPVDTNDDGDVDLGSDDTPPATARPAPSPAAPVPRPSPATSPQPTPTPTPTPSPEPDPPLACVVLPILPVCPDR